MNSRWPQRELRSDSYINLISGFSPLLTCSRVLQGADVLPAPLHTSENSPREGDVTGSWLSNLFGKVESIFHECVTLRSSLLEQSSQQDQDTDSERHQPYRGRHIKIFVSILIRTGRFLIILAITTPQFMQHARKTRTMPRRTHLRSAFGAVALIARAY
jgi:hypothetical protein